MAETTEETEVTEETTDEETTEETTEDTTEETTDETEDSTDTTEETTDSSEDSSEEETVVTTAEVLAYLGIDYTDDMNTTNITRAISAAELFLTGSIGEGYDKTDARVKELALIVVADLFDNRTLQAQGGGNVSTNVRRLVDDFSLQLRLELRRSSANE